MYFRVAEPALQSDRTAVGNHRCQFQRATQLLLIATEVLCGPAEHYFKDTKLLSCVHSLISGERYRQSGRGALALTPIITTK